MKHTLFLLTFFILFSCQDKTLKITYINGSIVGLKANDTLRLIPADEYHVGINLLDNNYPISICDSMGNFAFEVKDFRTGYYQLHENVKHELDYDLYIEAGDSLTIDKPYKDVEDHIQITGKGAEKLNYLSIDNQHFSYEADIFHQTRSDKFKTEMEFKAYIDSLYEQRLNRLFANKNTPKHLKKHFETSLVAEKTEYLLEHLVRRNQYMKGTFEYFYPDPAYYSFKSEFAKIDSNQINTQLKSVANHILNHNVRLAFKELPIDQYWDERAKWKLDYLENMPNSIWKDISILSSCNDFSLDMSTEGFLEDLVAFNHKIRESFTSESCKQLFNNEVETYLKLAPGQLAPDFELPDSTGTLQKLSDYKGKIVYIDFWGSWCHWCIKEIPGALKLHEKYEDSPIVFMYISMESENTSVEEWKDFIAGRNEDLGKILKNKPMPGVHLLAHKLTKNPEIKPYQVTMAPTYVLIDHNGKNGQCESQKTL